MPNANTSRTVPTRVSGAPADTSSQGVYKAIATFRRQQTLTPAQLDPTQASAKRRQLFKTGQPTSPAGYRRPGSQS